MTISSTVLKDKDSGCSHIHTFDRRGGDVVLVCVKCGEENVVEYAK